MNISEKIFQEAKNYLGDAKSYIGKEAAGMKSKYCNCSQNDTAAIAAALLLGTAIGAALGILFAPNKGSQTRSNVADTMKDLSYKASDKIKQGREALSNLKNKAENKEESTASKSSTAGKEQKKTKPES